MQCRACLKTSCESVTRLDELQIMCFNLITHLSIHKEDSMPQHLCDNCTKDLEFCVQFREKCITSNSLLVHALTLSEDSNLTTHIKQEIHLEYDDEMNHDVIDDSVGIQVKQEYNDLQNNDIFKSEENFEYEYISDVQRPNIENSSTQTLVPNKEKTKKVETQKAIKMPPRAVKNGEKTSNEKEPASIKYDCGLCTEKVEKDKFSDHFKNHESKNYCSICSLYFNDWETTLYHRISHLINIKPIICHTCLRGYTNSITLEYHYNTKHLNKGKEAAKCRICNRVFANLRYLKRHMITHISTGKTYPCNECSEVFSKPNARQYHVSKYHRKNKIWACDECDYKCKFGDALRLHKLRMHSPDKVRCELCPAMFKDASRLKMHKCKYSAKSICPICGEEKVPKMMKRHLASHSDERRYKCGRCDAAYKSRDALRVHLDRHDNVRARKCEFCPATFFASTSLTKHRRIHTGEKPYLCQVCNKGFTANHNLKVHMKVHGVFNLIKKKGSEEESIDNVQQSSK